MDCYINAPLLSEDVCVHMSDVNLCLTGNNCSSEAFQFDDTVAFYEYVMLSACAEPTCDADATIRCLQDDVYATEIFDETECLNSRLKAQNCFVDNGCIDSLDGFLMVSFADFILCDAIPTLPPLCFGTLNLEDQSRSVSFDFNDTQCNLYLNKAECLFDGGKSYENRVSIYMILVL